LIVELGLLVLMFEEVVVHEVDFVTGTVFVKGFSNGSNPSIPPTTSLTMSRLEGM
jgi:hypothetical protein